MPPKQRGKRERIEGDGGPRPEPGYMADRQRSMEAAPELPAPDGDYEPGKYFKGKRVTISDAPAVPPAPAMPAKGKSVKSVPAPPPAAPAPAPIVRAPSPDDIVLPNDPSPPRAAPIARVIETQTDDDPRIRELQGAQRRLEELRQREHAETERAIREMHEEMQVDREGYSAIIKQLRRELEDAQGAVALANQANQNRAPPAQNRVQANRNRVPVDRPPRGDNNDSDSGDDADSCDCPRIMHYGRPYYTFQTMPHGTPFTNANLRELVIDNNNSSPEEKIYAARMMERNRRWSYAQARR